MQLFVFKKRGRKMFAVKRNLFIQGNICESKNRNKFLYLIGKNVTSATNPIFTKLKLRH